MSKQDEGTATERGDEGRTNAPAPEQGKKSGTRIESKGVPPPADDEETQQPERKE